jgi:DNA (cytosine-5)-methyltransferase 1
VTDLVVDTFAGPGGWSEGLRALGLSDVGIELDAAACATRAAAGHETIRADVATFDPGELGEVWGLIGSPPCTTFSAAGDQAGNAVMEHLATLIRDLFAGRDTRQAHIAAMEAALTGSEWAAELEPAKRAEKISKAAASAALVSEPARFIHACGPEWIALEQVPAVLPLWGMYAGELRKCGYHVWAGKLNAADYGVPQTRERAILIASRARQVFRPEPTHYDPRKGDQLWGTPWVSMAEALGWGATGRAAPTVTAGGTNTGGAEPFGHRDRDALTAEQEAGQWALRAGNQPHAAVRPAPAPAPAMAFGHNAARMQWVLHTNRDQREDGSRQTSDPQTAPAPAPALTAKSGGQWVMRRQVGAALAETRRDHEVDEPAPTITGGGSSADSVRITVEEAAVLQSFRADYPWQGTKTKRFEQVGNAVPPLLAQHVLAMATGAKRLEAAA